MPTKPLVYISYAYPDDTDGFVSTLAEYLSAELQLQTGTCARVAFDLDRRRPSSILSQTIPEDARNATFLVPILTPSYLGSTVCRDELEMFEGRQRDLGTRRVFPVYFFEAREFEAKGSATYDWSRMLRPGAVDLRAYRFALGSLNARKQIAVLAASIRKAQAQLPQEPSSAGAGPPRTANEVHDPIYVESLSLRNFRCFEELEIRFEHESHLGGRWTCIAGINGAGKSSILQAVGVALLGDRVAAELGGERLNRMRQRADLMNRLTAEVEIVLEVPVEGSVPLKLRIGEHGRVASASEDADAVRLRLADQVIVAYGATRNLSSRTDNSGDNLSPDVRRQITLFDPLSQLAGADALLSKQLMRRPQIPPFQALLTQVFGSEFRIVERSHDGFLFVLADTDFVGAIDLPDGYRAAAAWLADLCAAWCEKEPELAKSGNPADIQAIVLIDEVDLHLHPKLQRELVPRLRKALPKVQWIVTTHSPLVLANFDSSEIIALDRNEPGGVRKLDRQIMGFSANEIYEWLMDTPSSGAAMEEKLKEAGDDPAKQREAAELLQASPKVDGEEAKLTVAEMLERLEQLEK